MFANPNNSFRKRLVHLVSLWRARKLLARAKYVHLIHNDKFAKPFVDFLNRNFPPEEHLVLCKRMLNLYSAVELAG